jgi:hypothetical protein
MSKRNGSANTVASRLPDGYISSRRSPARTRWPAISTSSAAVRIMFWIGLTQRSISSSAPGSRDGSARSARSWSGLRSSAWSPPLITWRVVSSPPIRIRSDSMNSESSSRRSPSISACTSTLMRSSPGGFARRSATTRRQYSRYSSAARACAAMRSGSLLPSARMRSSDQRSSRPWSSSATPSRSPITISGSRAATSNTNSHSPRSTTSSRIIVQISRTRRS